MNMIVGVGPNQVQIPVRFSEKTVAEILDELRIICDVNQIVLYVRRQEETYASFEVWYLDYHLNRDASDQERKDFEWRADIVQKYFFKSYYGGCGDCDSFYIKEVPLDKPFINWDLD